MTKVFINQFNGGIVNDPREPSLNKVRMVTNMDVLTNPYKASPYHDSVSGDSAGSATLRQNFCIALRTGTTYSLFGLGVVSGSGKAQVDYKNLTTGASTDLDDNGWGSTANNASASGTTSFLLLVYYKRTGKVYGAKGIGATSSLWGYDPSGSAAFSEDIVSTETSAGQSSPSGIKNIAQGLVHSKDDVLYIPTDNVILSNNAGTWNLAALTLPSNLYITSLSEKGNYLAIGCAPLNGVGKSFTYLWDRDSSLATLSESVDFGDGNLRVLENVGGRLIGISLSGANSTRFKDKVIFRSYSLGTEPEAQNFLELEGSTTTVLPIAKQKLNGRLYFMMSVTLNGSVREGVWSLGITANGFSLIHERTPNNDTALSSGTILNFFFVGDYLFQAYSSGGNNAVSKTNDQASYTATSIVESLINPGMAKEDRRVSKKLNSIGALYDPLTSGQQVVVKCRKEGGSYAAVFTETTVGKVRTEPITKFADGSQLPTGTELEFRLESTGGAVITGLVYDYEPQLTN